MTTIPATPSTPPISAGPQRRARPTGVLEIIHELWDARDLVSQFVLRDITIRYTQAIMGFAWAMLMPVLIVCSGLLFRLVISLLSNQPLDGASIASLAVKALPWAFFSGAIGLATQSIIAYSGLIGKVYFPREALPLASVLAQAFDLLIGLATITVILTVLGQHVGASALWAPLLLALLLIFTVGCALILSCANLFFRDVKYIVQVVLNFGIFATPVFFEPQLLGPSFGRLMMLLPLSPFIEGMQVAVVDRSSLLTTVIKQSGGGPVVVWEPAHLLYAVLLAFSTLAIGLRVFRRFSSRFAENA
jgi:lipopolysaccharide transport system permease protein